VDPDAHFALARLLPEPLLVVRIDGALEAANAAAGRLLGSTDEDLKGRRFADFLADPPEAVAALLKACARSRALLPGALTLRLPDGGELPLRCEGALYRQSCEGMAGAVLLRLSSKAEGVAKFVLLKQRIEELSAEIHRRRRAEAALHETTERYRITLASIGDAVIATDVNGRVEFINTVAQQLTGWAGTAALGRHLDEVFAIVNEQTRQTVESPVAKVLRLGAVVGLANHTVLLRRDGSELPIDDSGAPIRDAEGRIIGVVLVFRDLSERYALERELLARAQRLEDADRRKDEFLSMLAHELRNPLAPLANGVQLLARRFGQLPDVGELSALMDRQVRHMSRLVDDLLDVARLTRGNVELRKGDVDLADAIRQAVEMSRPILEARGVQPTVPSLAESVRLHADLTRLVQVFGNLLSNAAKFSPPGARVDVDVRRAGGEVLVSVRDMGTGIDPQLLPRVFDLFVQGDRSLDRRQSGLGLGLTIAQSIVHMHGGVIEARSEGPGRGSEFTVRLPVLDAASSGAQVPDASSGQPAAAGAGLSLVVVDDNVDAAGTLCTILELLGHRATAVHEPHAALALVRDTRPEAVLLDIGLPGMDGFGLARAIRELAGPQPFLVAVSGYGDAQSRRKGLESGMDEHLTKPVDPMVLDALLRQRAAAS